MTIDNISENPRHYKKSHYKGRQADDGDSDPKEQRSEGKPSISEVYAAAAKLKKGCEESEIMAVFQMLRKVGPSNLDCDRTFEAIKTACGAAIKTQRLMWATLFGSSEPQVQSKESLAVLAEIKRNIGREYVAPAVPGLKPHFTMWQNRPWLVKVSSPSESGYTPPDVLLCTPIEIVGGISFVDQGDATGLRINVYNASNAMVTIDVRAGDLAAPQDVMRKLYDAGARFNPPDGREFAFQALSTSQASGPQVHAVAGFHYDLDGELAYLHPSGEVIPPLSTIELQKESRITKASTRGTYSAWQEDAATVFMSEGAHLLKYAVLSGLVGCVNNLGGLEGPEQWGGFLGLFEGRSTNFKTGALRHIASAWGNPLLNRGGKLVSGNASAGAFELKLPGAVGNVQCYDEVSGVTPTILADLGFKLEQGEGKATMTNTRAAAPIIRFPDAVAFTSAEVGMVQRLREESKEAAGGLGVRCIAKAVANYHAPPRPIQLCAARMLRNYGWHGRILAKQLIADRYNAERVQKEVTGYAAELEGADTDDRLARAGRLFGVYRLAGEMGKKAGIFPMEWNVEAFVGEMWEHHQDSDLAPADPLVKATDSYLEQIVAAKGSSIIFPDQMEKPHNGVLIGYAAQHLPTKHPAYIPNAPHEANDVYVLRASEMGSMIKSVPVRDVREELFARDILIKPKVGRSTTWSYFPGLARHTQYIVLRASLIDAATDFVSKEDADVYKAEADAKALNRAEAA